MNSDQCHHKSSFNYQISLSILQQQKEWDVNKIQIVINTLQQQQALIEQMSEQVSQLQDIKSDLDEQIYNSNVVQSKLISENGDVNYELYQLTQHNQTLQDKVQQLQQHQQYTSVLESQLYDIKQNSSVQLEQIYKLQLENKHLINNNAQLMKIIDDLEQQIAKQPQDRIVESQINIQYAEQIHNLQQDNEQLSQQIQQLIQQLDMQQISHRSVMSYSNLVSEAPSVYDSIIIDQPFGDVLTTDADQQIDESVELIDESILYAQDYQGIKDLPVILKIIADESQKSIQQQPYFSDCVNRISIKGQKAKRIFFITSHCLYIFDDINIKLTRQVPLDKIQSIICAETSPLLCCIKFNHADDYLIETFKRKQLIEYLTLRSKINISYADNFVINFKGYQPKQLSELSNGAYMSGVQGAFKLQSKQGIVKMQQRRRFGFMDWIDVFLLVADCGLLIFNQAGDVQPMAFIPFTDSLVLKNPIGHKGHNLKLKHYEQEYIFNVTSYVLLDEWYSCLHQQIVNQHKLQLITTLR